MKRHLHRWALPGVALAAILAATTLACGGGDDSSSSPTSSSQATKPAASATTASTAASTPAASATAATTAASTPGGGGGGGTELTIVAKNTLWEPTELKAEPGKVAITLDNQDDGIPHNLHVYKGTDNTGQDMGKTELEAGPTKQTLTLDLAAGEYFYVCEVHPATMSGKLEVE